MPNFQRFVDRYQKDANVNIITVNVHDLPNKVQPWLENNHYNFPVLIDDGYAFRAGVAGFPTTWFVDSNGSLAFHSHDEEVVDLEQEYTWRVEALKREFRIRSK